LPPPPSVIKQVFDETAVENSEQHLERPDNKESKDASPSPTTGNEPQIVLGTVLNVYYASIHSMQGPAQNF
jgi:hypothetical protein